MKSKFYIESRIDMHQGKERACLSLLHFILAQQLDLDLLDPLRYILVLLAGTSLFYEKWRRRWRCSSVKEKKQVTDEVEDCEIDAGNVADTAWNGRVQHPLRGMVTVGSARMEHVQDVGWRS
uniref:Uncharacterized protein n=1 Tax=Arundo donax TaxID=35708 RepID=A0A0A9FBC7_ARUDO